MMLNNSENTDDFPLSNYFLMRSPLQPIGIVGCYLLVVLYVGPTLMRNRNPYAINKILIAYNILQIISNVTLFIVGLYLLPELNFTCTPVNLSNSPTAVTMVQAHYYYFLLKLIDLLDTIFFVLRKKKQQITFLHVHHHAGIFVAAWISGKYFPGGHAVYVGLFNTFVHSIMYGYYLLTVAGFSRGSLWWRKHLTQLQIVQMCLIFLTFFLQLINPSCSYPKFLTGLFLPNAGVVIYLFGKFYRREYVLKSKNN